MAERKVMQFVRNYITKQIKILKSYINCLLCFSILKQKHLRSECVFCLGLKDSSFCFDHFIYFLRFSRRILSRSIFLMRLKASTVILQVFSGFSER